MAQTLVAISPEELTELVRKAIRDELSESPPKPRKNYVDAKEIAEHFGVSRATVHAWIHEESCPHILKGRVLRFELAAVEAWFRGREPGLKRVK
jgi:excisionase family DNA binding protein